MTLNAIFSVMATNRHNLFLDSLIIWEMSVDPTSFYSRWPQIRVIMSNEGWERALNLWRKKDYKTFEKHIDLQSQAIYVSKKKFKKSLHILEDSVSNVQVDILNMQSSIICSKYDGSTLYWCFS